MEFKIGDRIVHPEYGSGEIFEISKTMGFVDINLDEPYTNIENRIKTSVIVPITEIKLEKYD